MLIGQESDDKYLNERRQEMIDIQDLKACVIVCQLSTSKNDGRKTCARICWTSKNILSFTKNSSRQSRRLLIVGSEQGGWACEAIQTTAVMMSTYAEQVYAQQSLSDSGLGIVQHTEEAVLRILRSRIRDYLLNNIKSNARRHNRQPVPANVRRCDLLASFLLIP
jgi:hypothetical protein